MTTLKVKITIKVKVTPEGEIGILAMGVSSYDVPKKGIHGLKIEPVQNAVFECMRWASNEDDKKPLSCVGCDIDCFMKFQYNGTPVPLERGR